MGLNLSKEEEKITMHDSNQSRDPIKVRNFIPGKFRYLTVISLVAILLTAGAAASSQAQIIPNQENFPDSVFMTSGTTMHEMALKALYINEQATKVSGFKIDMAKVVLVSPSTPNLAVSSPDSSLIITGAKLRTETQRLDLPGRGNTYSLAGLAQGVYTLDVITQKGNNQGSL